MLTQEEEFIQLKVKELRERLARTVESMKNLSDRHVVEISQELDWYILQLQKMNFSETKNKGNEKTIEGASRILFYQAR
ncbi:aspartyl-phosphate phosphatase Spo0E family protein [Paenibacillus sp. MER 180]|uniref:aspartyl-phosphate phosphatase Spo0E family protein n=1 Tax=Paenibacillus sp. MER 180 TaxID=2939570 RepID=UPI00203C0CAA|nr:aspartyl-phosphate phosphatase Spo0E family protein [Paenibacillus sp. MER 180]MCM3293523.1 aspartyl-phosphate phosphatase Spo0E family protein [Paenibacillus sp. MER 180]